MRRVSIYISALFAFLCLAIKGNCQSKCDCFDRLYHLAHYESDTLRSIEILKDAISFLGPSRQGEYYWEVAQSYSKLKQYDSSAAWYEKAIEWGYDIESLKWYSPEVYRRMDTNRIKAITAEHRKKIDPVLYQRFEAQFQMDQVVRSGEFYTIDEKGDTLKGVKRKSLIDSIFQKVDDSTFRFLKWVFRKYEFPTFHELGFFPMGIMPMILHVTDYRNENATYIFNKLREFSNKCEFQRSSLLFLMDRQKYNNDKKSYCGLIGAGQRFLNIEDISKADSIRFAYNQLRLKEEAAYWDGKLKLPPDYKPRPYPKNYFCLKKYEIK